MSTTTPKNTKRYLTLICLISIMLILPITFVFAQDKYGLEETAKTAELKGTQTDADLPVIIGNIIYAFLGFLGVVFFVLVLYGGFTWMTSQGNKENITKAQGIIVSAAIGLTIVLVSYVATSFIMNEIINSTGIQNNGDGGGSNTVCSCVPGNSCLDKPGNNQNCGPHPDNSSYKPCNTGTICCCGDPN